jgi:ABC-2 type transport system ATP-binding protein
VAALDDPPTSRTHPHPPGTLPALEPHGLAKRNAGRRALALDGLDLAVPAGSITALVGPNGAGKSTLIKAWASLERPSAGSVAVLGIDPWRHRGEALARIGYVPQSPALYRAFTVADHVALAVSLRRSFDRPVAERRMVDLGIPLDARAGELSGGQQAQVGLALALGTRAPVLLLDEPLASLDPLARREFLHVLVAGARESGATVLLSSHVITDVQQACDRLVVLGEGHLLLDEAISAALARHAISDGEMRPDVPGTRPVATFLGEQGEALTLWELPDGAPSVPGLRPATLEELVLGRLASGRSPFAPTSVAA